MNNSITHIIIKCMMLLGLLSLFLFNISAADVFPPDAPVSIEIQVSKDKIYVGDSIDVYATITLLKDHPNYVEGREYRIGKRKTYNMVRIGGELMPLHLEEPPLWEILYSDEEKIISDDNPLVTFHFRQKLNRMPDRKNLYIRVSVSPTQKITANFGNPFADQIVERIEVTCLDEGLEYKPVIFPEDRKYRGEGSYNLEDFDSEPLKVDLNTPPKVKDLREMNPELFKIEADKVE